MELADEFKRGSHSLECYIITEGTAQSDYIYVRFLEQRTTDGLSLKHQSVLCSNKWLKLQIIRDFK